MTNVQTKESVSVIDVDPQTLERWLESGEAVLVDVREDFERRAERIEPSLHKAMSKFDPTDLYELPPSKRVVFHCRSGRRSLDAAERFRRHPEQELYHLAGGIEAWKRSGLATARSAGAPKIDVLRQVQMTAGTLVLVGAVLGAFVSPWWLLLCGLVGGGLFLTGATGWCGMATLLSLMPWNRAPSSGRTT